MADENTPKADAQDVRPENIAANNAGVKAELESQDINGAHSAPGDDLFGNTGDALDNLRKEVTKGADDEAGTSPTVGDKPKVEPKETTADGKPGKVDEGITKPATDDKAAKADESADPFKDIQLPPGARPRSGEAFGVLKEKAKQEIEIREKEITRLKGEVESRDAKLKDPVPAELQTELKELREFRAKFDIEADPKFKSFDENVKSSQEFIYAQLLKNSNITQETVDLIRKYGGPENVKMEKIFGAMQDPTAQRLIESRIAEIEMQKFNKEQAQAAAKKNVAGYIEERRTQFETGKTAHNESTKAELGKLREQLPWMAEVKLSEKATEEEKKNAKEHNAFVKDVTAQLDSALQDDSPHMRAIMLAGMAQLFFVRNRYTALKAHSEGLEKANAELTTKLDKIKGASVSRLDRSAASTKDGSIPKEKEADIFSQRAGDALDNIRKQVIDEQARANS